MEIAENDVIVVGAGAAGLMAAWELVLAGKKLMVVEARDRTGGRIHSLYDPAFELPVETGAEFIHGNLELTQLLLQRGGIASFEVEGDFWKKQDQRFQKQSDFIEDYSTLKKKFRALKTDMSVLDFFNQYLNDTKYEDLRFTLQNYVEGYYAADISRASTLALQQELMQSDDQQYRVEGGYQKLADHLYEQCLKKGVDFHFSSPVETIHWKNDFVEISSPGKTLKAKKVLITVPAGVLQNGSIRFIPALPEKMEAAAQLGYGPVIKIILQFEQPFWKNRELTRGKNLDKTGFIFSTEEIPTWWTHYPKNVSMLTGWIGGPRAKALQEQSNQALIEKALQSLAQIFDTGTDQLRHGLKAAHVANWQKDPYSCGAYSYDVVDGNRFKKILKAPVENKIFFAGEALVEGPEIGTVNAALRSGRETAHEIVASFRK